MRCYEGGMLMMHIKDYAGHLGGQRGFGALADVRMVLAGTVREDTWMRCTWTTVVAVNHSLMFKFPRKMLEAIFSAV